jgi:hypothetical protein
MSCRCNPCATTPTNTAENELLPSQIENFTTAFFGSVTKTESNGIVQWILPCNLDIGLENNTRADGEGLACYFLRLFRDGIVGLTGSQGDPGASGANGYNAYSVTLLGFTQPTLWAPTVQVKSAYNPALVENLNIFIQGSGWYVINSGDTGGFLQLTLTKALDSVSGTISAGKLIIPAGYPGASVVGPTGPQGSTGAQGTPGESFTETNGQYDTSVGVDYALQATLTPVAFTTSSPQLLLPDIGTYLITAIVALEGDTAIALNDDVLLKLFNTSIAGEVAGSSQVVSNIVAAQKFQVVITVLYSTDAASQTVALYGSCTTSNVVNAIANRTVLSYVRLD